MMKELDTIREAREKLDEALAIKAHHEADDLSFEINKAVDEISKLTGEDFHGYRSEIYRVLSGLISDHAAHDDAIRREACTALDEAIADLERGFVSCDRCGYEEPSTTLDVYSMLKMRRAAILGTEPVRERKSE